MRWKVATLYEGESLIVEAPSAGKAKSELHRRLKDAGYKVSYISIRAWRVRNG